MVPSEVEDDARWRQGKGLELGFELEQAHFIFINECAHKIVLHTPDL